MALALLSNAGLRLLDGLEPVDRVPVLQHAHNRQTDCGAPWDRHISPSSQITERSAHE
eukprot:CAMPEP_0115870102 /NCGR_PEP_ID=MMETSP0287-20121206/22148_1 /TAXON_ID=412157 /ORGANISM="Chrysochromulina rotalis, Strain UIO044" /LENGTH=57 /DNA_ID=CAMNT_0003324803 /DNA_START=477 /DNA_END=650 /DNA_ORIENTATION=-